MGGYGHGFGYPLGVASRQGGESWTPAAMGTDIAIWVIPETLGSEDSQVALWADQSGNGNDLFQTVGSLKPIVVVDVIDGYKGAEVLKTGRYLVQTVFQTFNTDFEFFYIYSKTDGATSYLPISTLGSGSHYTRDNVNEAYQLLASGNNQYLTPADLTPIDGTVVLGSLRREGGVPDSAFNGVDVLNPTTQETANHALVTNVMHSGGGILVEAIIIPRICTTTERADINAYFASKYPSVGIG